MLRGKSKGRRQGSEPRWRHLNPLQKAKNVRWGDVHVQKRANILCNGEDNNTVCSSLCC